MSVSTWEFGSKAAYAYSSREETVAAVTAALFERTAQLCMSQGRVDIALTGGGDGIAVLSAAHSVMSGVWKSDADPTLLRRSIFLKSISGGAMNVSSPQMTPTAMRCRRAQPGWTASRHTTACRKGISTRCLPIRGQKG